MSSEVYLKWKVRNAEELHQELMARLTAEREHQARLLEQIHKSVQAIKVAAESRPDSSASSLPQEKTRLHNVSNHDTGSISASGIDLGQLAVTPGPGANDSCRSISEIDFSGLLPSGSNEEREKSQYVRTVAAELRNASIEDDKDKKCVDSFVAYLNSLIADDTLEFDYFKALIDRRLRQLKNTVKFSHDAIQKDKLIEYYALCNLIGIEPQHIERGGLDQEIRSMTAAFMKKSEEDFVYRHLKEAMRELNLSFSDEIELEGLDGVKIIDSDQEDCSIFMSQDSEGIIFETVAEIPRGAAVSMEKKHAVEDAAVKICNKHHQIIELMRQRGVDLIVEEEVTPSFEIIRKKTVNVPRRKLHSASLARQMGE